MIVFNSLFTEIGFSGSVRPDHGGPAGRAGAPEEKKEEEDA